MLLTPLNLRLTRPAQNLGGSGGNVARIPAGLGWDEITYPLGLGGTFENPTTTLTPESVVDPNIFTGTIYYADSSRPDNSGNGLTPATAKRDIDECIALGNAAALPYQVYIEAGDYLRRESINGDSGTASPTQPCAFIAQNGRVRMMASTPATFSLSAGNMYVAPISTAGRVFDRTIVDSNGIYDQMTNVVDVPTCQATPGSWVNTGGMTYVHRQDGLQPTLANTLWVRNINIADFGTFTDDLYLEGIDFEGGLQGCIRLDATAARAVGMRDCTMRYAGFPGTRTNGLELFNMSGIINLWDCDASCNFRDGLNFHGLPPPAPILYVLTNRCSGFLNGVAGGSTLINAYTLHDENIGLDLNGNYSGGTFDGSIAQIVDISKVCYLGSRIEMLDTPDPNDAAVRTGTGCETWIAGCTLISDLNAIYGDGSSTTEYQNSSIVGLLAGANPASEPSTPWTS